MPSLNISQVLAALKEEFPDLKPSRIRYYDDKGLITPSRSTSGYRKFSEDDVTRLRLILRMQRDRYLPLDVIAERLDVASQQGPAAAAPAAEVLDEEPLWTTMLQRQELVRAAEVEPRFVTDLENYGLITADAKGRFTPVCVTIVKTCATLTEYGLEPRHLRPFKSAAERERDLLEQVLAPLRARNSRRPVPGGEEDVAESAAVMARAAQQLHVSLFREAMEKSRFP